MSESESTSNQAATDPRIEFGDAVWEQALADAKKYRVSLDPTAEGGFIGTVVEFPRVFGEGDSAELCVASMHRLVAVAIATARKAGRAVPTPTQGVRRDQQVNVRVSASEKERLLAAARAAGYTGIGDYLRAVALKANDAA
ncbi:MAG: hypothetical protein HZB38_05670 [Planctomycetes bacterium]|nr:hypothetical protein [Planctomycetota bacterium]